MKKTIYLLVLVSIIISCNTVDKKAESELNGTEATKNDLLPEKVIVYNEVNYNLQSIPEWLSGVDNAFFAQLNESVLQSEVQLYSSNVFYQPELIVKMTDEDVRNNMTSGGEINAIYFIEEWSFNKKTYSLEKKIEAWSPVLEYYKEFEGVIDTTKKVKKLLYDVRELAGSDEKLIAENMTYEVNFSSGNNSEYLDLTKLVNLIVEPVIEGKVKSYDFFDKTELANIDVKQIFGYAVDSLEEQDPVTSKWVWKYIEHDMDFSEVEAFVFVEDWFIDTKTYAIRKKIKSIAPVVFRVRIDETGESYVSKRIAFSVNF